MIAAFLDLCAVVGAITIGCVIGGVLWFIVETLRDRRAHRSRRNPVHRLGQDLPPIPHATTWPDFRAVNHRGERVSHATIDELMPRVIEVEP